MYPMLYAANDIRETYTNNGISVLSDTISCIVTEERNGAFECVLTYPQNGKDYNLIQDDCLLKVKCDNNANRKLQMFRIYRHSGNENGITKFYAEHISYALNGYAVKPFSSGLFVANNALSNLYANSVYLPDGMRGFWKFESDISLSRKFDITIPCSVKAGMLETESCILNTYGGEFEFDNYTIKLHKCRGEDRGVVLAYGKNIKTITNDNSIDDTYTHIFPYAQYTDENGDVKTVTIDGSILECENSSLYTRKRVKIVDFSERCKNASHFNSTTLLKITEGYIGKNKIDLPKFSLTISFADLAESVEYKYRKNLETINLCDTVSVYYPKLGVENKVQVSRLVYDSVSEKISEVTIGDDVRDMLNKYFGQKKE